MKFSKFCFAASILSSNNRSFFFKALLYLISTKKAFLLNFLRIREQDYFRVQKSSVSFFLVAITRLSSAGLTFLGFLVTSVSISKFWNQYQLRFYCNGRKRIFTRKIQCYSMISQFILRIFYFIYNLCFHSRN